MQAIDTQDNQFHDGNGTTELGTILPAWWLNQIQAEILAVLAAGKVAPNKAHNNQMLNAINKLIAGAVVNNLTSSNADKPLSALQGKVLSEQIAAAVAGGFALRGSLGSRNLNDVIGAANYGVWDNSANTNATSEKNYPTTKAGTLLLLPSAYQGVQLYIPFDLNIIYIRHSLSNANNNWSSWRVIDETINALDSDSRTAALSAAMGKKLNEEKLGNSGQQTLNGKLYVVRNAWEKMRFVNADGSYWRYETHPTPLAGNNKRFNFVFSGADNVEQARVAFLDPNGTQTVAYQSWVDDNKVAKSGDTMTGSLNIRMSGGYSGVYLFSNGGGETRLEAVPENQRGDKIFQLADRQGTGSFTVYQFPKATEHQNVAYHSWVSSNFVGVNGNQTIHGEKNFSSRVRTSYNHDWVGFIANQEVEGKHVYFDGYVRDICRGSYQVVSEGGGKYVAKICTTPTGATNTDRRVVAMTISDTSIHTHAYGWLHECFVPSGTVAYFLGNRAPAGWLKANGAAISRSTYAKLFEVLGTYYGGGDGRTTFNIPDLRGEFLRSWDDGRGVDGGRALGTHQGDAIRNITGRLPVYDDLAANHGFVADGAFYHTRENVQLPEGNRFESGVRPHFDTSRVVPTANENRPRNVALLACIKI